MKKLTFSFILLTATFISYSCKQKAAKEAAASDTQIEKNAPASVLSSIVKSSDTATTSYAAGRYKKRSCCVGAPSRFRTTAQLAKNVSK